MYLYIIPIIGIDCVPVYNYLSNLKDDWGSNQTFFQNSTRCKVWSNNNNDPVICAYNNNSGNISVHAP